MADRLRGKVAVITGGASGIGQACAVRFAEEGADIVVADIRLCDETVGLVQSLGRRALFVKSDLTSETDCNHLAQEAASLSGRVDVAVLAAGIARMPGAPPTVETKESRLLLNLDLASFDRIIDVNLRGTLLSARAIARPMMTQGAGSIVTLASIAGRIPVAGSGAYCISKAGVIMLTQILALELATSGIRVNAVGPGFTTTPMWNVDTDSDAHRWAMSLTPMGRNGTSREQADACLYFACDESTYVTGQVLHPAGGAFTG